MELFDFTERTCLLLGGERVARLAASSVLVFGTGGVFRIKVNDRS